MSDGHVYCLGNVLGDGSSRVSTTFVEVSNIGNAVKISCGGGTACALLADHTIQCWGDDSAGQINGISGSRVLSPVTVTGISDATDVITDGSVTCALLASGAVSCWGQTDLSSNGPPSPPHTIGPLGPAVRLSGDLCAILGDGSVACWSGSTASPSALAELTDVMQVSGECALSTDGSVRCWGPGGAGQIGNGRTDDATSPQLVLQLGTTTAIAAAGHHACALLSDSSVACWGKDGTGDVIDYGPLPASIGQLGPVVHVAASAVDTCAIQADHVIKCWGYVGFGTDVPGVYTTPTVVGGLPSN